TYIAVNDDEVLEAFQLLCRTEGIMPALDPAHAISYAARLAGTLPKERIIVVNLSGRGDKDIDIVMKEILSTKYEMLNNIKAQNLNDQNMRVLNLGH
ncbi:MAG: hypothetical protein CO103_06315, partial [Chloroflexi bacterium CG_4_9_14_3_um_filter_45_9]